jgi:hypothetical protein
MAFVKLMMNHLVLVVREEDDHRHLEEYFEEHYQLKKH